MHVQWESRDSALIIMQVRFIAHEKIRGVKNEVSYLDHSYFIVK